MFYRIIFILAGLYNLFFGILLFLDPEKLFGFFYLPVLLDKTISAPMAGLIAVFSLIYFYAAWKPEKSKKLVMLALLSKIAPTLAALFMLIVYNWPANVFAMILVNDWIWLLPIALFLRKKKTIDNR